MQNLQMNRLSKVALNYCHGSKNEKLITSLLLKMSNLNFANEEAPIVAVVPGKMS